MPVELLPSTADTPATLRVVGRFDFSQHEAFRRAYESLPTGVSCVVDLGDAEYLDSSALGMLLLLRRHAGDAQHCVALARVRPEIRRILVIARFDTLFAIDA